jgi:hypothetical protein
MTPPSRLAAVAVLAWASLAFAGDHVIDLSAHGFTLSALEPTGDAGDYQAVMMFLPATEKFSPNVNVMVQQNSVSFEDYLKQSRDEFAKMGVKVIVDKPGKNDAVFEYSMVQQGKELHFYARMVPGKGKVMLATATALESQWKNAAVSGALKKCVDSLKAAK